MADFDFLQKPLSKKWSIIVPGRSNRPKAEHIVNPVCPFCVGQEEEGEIDRYPFDTHSAKRLAQSEKSDTEWLVRVIPNKYPFADHHELIIHSPDHHKNIDELPEAQVKLILQMYQRRYKEHQNKGTVVIFHNRGEKAGESLPHPHTQLVVLPHKVKIETPSLRDLFVLPEKEGVTLKPIETEHFTLFCPRVSDWPYEVVIAPKRRRTRFCDATTDELADLAGALQMALHGLNDLLGEEFPFNYYIYPLFDWYLRITPRLKVIGGFEVATHISVVTKDPAETMEFLREKFAS